MARDPKRIPEMCDLLSQIWKKYPDMRLGQLVFNVCRPDRDTSKIFFIEDDKMEEILKGILENGWDGL